MHQTVGEFFKSSEEALELFNAWALTSVPKAKADHICYKCSTKNEFEHLRGLFESHSSFAFQSIISERRIAVIKFLHPIQSALGDIWYLELSDQKPDGSQMSGFDHIEIFPTRGSMEGLATNLESRGATLTKSIKPHHTAFDITLNDSFKVRIEPETLIEKIKRDETL